MVPALNHTVPRHDGDPTLSYDLGSLSYDIAYQPNWFKSVPYNAFRISAVWIRHAVVPRTSSRCLLSQPTTGSKLLAPRRLVAFCLVLYSYRSNSAADQMVALHHDRRQIGRWKNLKDTAYFTKSVLGGRAIIQTHMLNRSTGMILLDCRRTPMFEHMDSRHAPKFEHMEPTWTILGVRRSSSTWTPSVHL